MMRNVMLIMIHDEDDYGVDSMMIMMMVVVLMTLWVTLLIVGRRSGEPAA